MKSIKGSIGGLDKSAKKLVVKLEESGFSVDYSCFKSGRGDYSESNIEITAEKEIDEDNTNYISITIHANGYGEIVKWSDIKKQVINASKLVGFSSLNIG